MSRNVNGQLGYGGAWDFAFTVAAAHMGGDAGPRPRSPRSPRPRDCQRDFPCMLEAGIRTFQPCRSVPAPIRCPVVVTGSTTPAQVAQRLDGVSMRSGVFYPCLVSEQLRAGWWALETNAGPTGNVTQQLEGLGDQTGDSLKAELVARGFTILALADDSPLTVLAGNPFFGWEELVAPLRDDGARVAPDALGRQRACRGKRGVCLAVTAILRCLEAASPAGPGRDHCYGWQLGERNMVSTSFGLLGSRGACAANEKRCWSGRRGDRLGRRSTWFHRGAPLHVLSPFPKLSRCDRDGPGALLVRLPRRAGKHRPRGG